MDAAAIQVIIDKAVALALANAAVNAPTPFTLVPGDRATHWNFSAGHGLKLFLNGTKALEDKFDSKQEHLNHFLNQLQDRAICVWMGRHHQH
jgi:hypothetical protein